MARTRSIHRRAAAAAALSALCLGFTLPATASNTAHEASADGLARAAEARTGDDAGGDFTTQGISWR